MKIKPKYQTITINQLKWVLDPLAINGEHLVTYHEAKDYADKNGLKLPTQKQFAEFINVNKIYDKVNNGVWINPYDISKEFINTENALFLPYLGYINLFNQLKDYKKCAAFWTGDEKLNDQAPYKVIYFSEMAFTNGYSNVGFKFQALFIL